MSAEWLVVGQRYLRLVIRGDVPNPRERPGATDSASVPVSASVALGLICRCRTDPHSVHAFDEQRKPNGVDEPAQCRDGHRRDARREDAVRVDGEALWEWGGGKIGRWAACNERWSCVVVLIPC